MKRTDTHPYPYPKETHTQKKQLHLSGGRRLNRRGFIRISGMVPSAGTENLILITQLHLENVNDDIQGVDLANRINYAFLEPTRIYQPLDPTAIQSDLDQPTIRVGN